MAMVAPVDDAPALGELLRRWRARRRISQLELASQAGVSSRHLSFVETGRSKASREMVLHLAEQLDVPLRDRNALLVAAGFAPLYRESPLDGPELTAVREAISLVLRHHEPMPALVIDQAWNLVDANAGVTFFLGLLPEHLLAPPVNVVRASLHPDGLARVIVNQGEYAGHLLERLRRQLDTSGDPGLAALLDEVADYPVVRAADAPHGPPGPVLPIQLRVGDEVLSFFTTMTVFGAPLDVTLSELAIESFFAADEATAAAVRRLGDPTSVR